MPGPNTNEPSASHGWFDFTPMTANSHMIKTLVSSASFSYGLFCIGACLCMRQKVPISRSYLISVPAFGGMFGWMYTHPPE
jgi:hypothetical protein